jgi:hypothetical protein
VFPQFYATETGGSNRYDHFTLFEQLELPMPLPRLYAALLASALLSPLAAPLSAQTADAQSTAIVSAADAFLATLTDAQKSSVLFEFSDAVQRVHWTNFPQGGPGADRAGVKWGDMTANQQAALTALLGAVLSPDGLLRVQEQMAADDIVAAADAAESSGSSDGRPPVSFGTAYYFVSFVGTPSVDSPWMLQFGGHHMAINATVVGPNVTLSPTLSGGQPLKFTYNGEAVYTVEQEAMQASALLAMLTPEQQAIAVISDQMGDLVLGPGQDGKVLQPEGLAGADMTADQKAAFLALIEDRLNMLNADDLAVTMAPISAGLDQTYFGWWGPVDPVGAAYFRVTGPTVIIEFSPQSNDGDPTDHAHNMYRDPTNEYGAAWTALE